MVPMESCAHGGGSGCGVVEMVEYAEEATEGQRGRLGGRFLRMLITGMF